MKGLIRSKVHEDAHLERMQVAIKPRCTKAAILKLGSFRGTNTEVHEEYAVKNT